MGAILKDVKNALGLDSDAEGYDPELIMHINGALSEFNQLGIGPDEGFFLEDGTESWESFMTDDPRYNMAQTLLFMKVKMVFDPPQVGYVLTSYEKLIEKYECRLRDMADEIKFPDLPEHPVTMVHLDPYVFIEEY